MIFGWKVLHISDRETLIRKLDGEIIVISADSAQGYSFVEEYLQMMRENYSGHLLAADMLLQKILGEQYRHLRVSERLYNIRLAQLSIACVFGDTGEDPDCDEMGELRFRYVQCPLRTVCPVNGYNVRSRNGLACCNPIYETILTNRQTQLADLLVNTSYSYDDIGELMNIARGRVKNLAHEVFAAIGVCDRQELTVMLKGKRLK